MKLTYNVLTASLLTALSCSAMAVDIDVYGRANISLQQSDDGAGSFSEVNSNASRLGFKGKQTLESGLEVLFQAEYQLDMDGDSSGGSNFKDRNQFIGLKGDFGTVLVGNNDTMLKKSQGKVDLFGDVNGDIKHLWEGENREANSVSYYAPSFNGVNAGVSYITEDEVGAKVGISAAVSYGDAKLKKSDFYAAVAIDKDVDGQDIIRLTGQTKISGVTLGAIYQTQEASAGGSEVDGILVSAKYKVNDFDLKAQVQTANEDGGADKMSYSLGADYKLAQNITSYGYFTSIDNDTGNDASYLAVGMIYKF